MATESDSRNRKLVFALGEGMHLTHTNTLDLVVFNEIVFTGHNTTLTTSSGDIPQVYATGRVMRMAGIKISTDIYIGYPTHSTSTGEDLELGTAPQDPNDVELAATDMKFVGRVIILSGHCTFSDCEFLGGVIVQSGRVEMSSCTFTNGSRFGSERTDFAECAKSLLSISEDANVSCESCRFDCKGEYSGITVSDAAVIQVDKSDIQCSARHSIMVSGDASANLNAVAVEGVKAVGIHVSGRAQVKARHLTIRDAGSHGIDVSEAATTTIVDSTIKNCKTSGIHMSGQSKTTINDTTVKTCRVGILMPESSATLCASDCSILRNRTMGAVVLSLGCDLLRCKVMVNGGDGISAVGPKNSGERVPPPAVTQMRQCDVSDNRGFGINAVCDVGNGELQMVYKDCRVNGNTLGQFKAVQSQMERDEKEMDKQRMVNMDWYHGSAAKTIAEEATKLRATFGTEFGFQWDESEFEQLYSKYCAVKGMAKKSQDEITENLQRGLELSEFLLAVPELSNESESWARRLLTVADTNGEGKCNFGDYVRVMYLLKHASFKERVKFLFGLYDLGGKGRVTLEDILTVMLGHKSERSHFDQVSNVLLLEDVFRHVHGSNEDKEGWGSMRYEDFVKCLSLETPVFLGLLGRLFMKREVKKAEYQAFTQSQELKRVMERHVDPVAQSQTMQVLAH
eukprot:GFYU01013868.1.p1 GENE.GFYU01013868.1~~GFYU01013868.1.p1  ORF type:complete len:724 (+),score=168.28 GFYU01013868.1:128-2173(+)